ncbi:hypothetical protein GCM10022419_124380 [Nonomuraea rosea]|uniref:Uncharacterized protein n=1 Tax=Nonomuraea rosea TaxID=638574 RepID=A0ABP6ZRY4_9ACTN
MVERDSLQALLRDPLAPCQERVQGRATDQVGQRTDHAAGALVRVTVQGGEGTGAVRAQAEGVLQGGEQLAKSNWELEPPPCSRHRLPRPALLTWCNYGISAHLSAIQNRGGPSPNAWTIVARFPFTAANEAEQVAGPGEQITISCPRTRTAHVAGTSPSHHARDAEGHGA